MLPGCNSGSGGDISSTLTRSISLGDMILMTADGGPEMDNSDLISLTNSIKHFSAALTHLKDVVRTLQSELFSAISFLLVRPLIFRQILYISYKWQCLQMANSGKEITGAELSICCRKVNKTNIPRTFVRKLQCSRSCYVVECMLNGSDLLNWIIGSTL